MYNKRAFNIKANHFIQHCLMMHNIILLNKAFNKSNKARIKPPAIILEAKVLTLAYVN